MRAPGAVLLLLSLASCVGPAASKAPAKSSAALPPLDHAPLLQAKQATDLTSGETVLGIEIAGDARAYPLRILDRHAVANDTVGRVPVALAWCPACGSAVAYRTSTPRGALTLAVSGQLLRDGQTGTLWQPLTGKAVEGPLARSGVELEPLPVVLTTWGKWLQLHPRTRVLSLEPGTGREAPPEGEASVPETSWIYGLVLDGTAKAYPVERLKREGVVNDELAGRPVLVVWEPGADATNRTVRAYERGDRVFGPNERAIFGAIFLVDQEGRPWRLGEEALTTADGKRLARLPGRLANRAAWFSAYPRTLILGDDGTVR